MNHPFIVKRKTILLLTFRNIWEKKFKQVVYQQSSKFPLAALHWLVTLMFKMVAKNILILNTWQA